LRFENYLAGAAIGAWSLEPLKDANAILYSTGYSSEDIAQGRGFFQRRPVARAWREALAGLFGRIS